MIKKTSFYQLIYGMGMVLNILDPPHIALYWPWVRYMESDMFQAHPCVQVTA